MFNFFKILFSPIIAILDFITKYFKTIVFLTIIYFLIVPSDENIVDGNIHAKEGEAWWFDNSQLHWVTNNTDSDRLAMIVCIRTEKYKDKNARRI